VSRHGIERSDGGGGSGDEPARQGPHRGQRLREPAQNGVRGARAAAHQGAGDREGVAKGKGQISPVGQI